MNNVSTIPPAAPRMAGLVPNSFEQAIQLANIMATSKLVPLALQKSPGDCLMVIEQAMRWSMSCFAVAQEVSVIQGKMMFSGKIIAAALHSAPGLLVGRLEYQFTGTGADLQVEAIGHLRGEDAPRTITVRLADARTSNSHWSKSPEQMLSYHAARVWARRFTPEIILGVFSPEEWTAPLPAPASDHDAAPPRHITRTTDAVALPAPPMPLHAPPATSEPDRHDAAMERLLARVAACTTVADLHAVAGDAAVFKGLVLMQVKRPDLVKQYEDAMRAAHGVLPDADGVVADAGADLDAEAAP